MNKKIYLIAGPNGAGKTTFANEFLPNEGNCLHFVNADLIAAGISPFAPQLAAHRAGRLMLQQMDYHVQQQHSFALETTLAGLAYLQRIPHWRALGYQINLFFLALPDVDMALQRVANRVRQGGHSIPEDVIKRRFVAGLRNLPRYCQQVDNWAIFDNSDTVPVLIEFGRRHETDQ